jgi:hypothetical protein
MDLLTMLITAYVPLENAGMKLLTAIFGFGICIIVLDYLRYFGVTSSFVLEWCFDGISVVIHQTILQLNSRSYAGRASVNSMFVGSSRAGAFEKWLNS